ncbi:hypothetical protein KQI65_10245 [bacterium]|nr:hypothetical protein [bacterium]
MRGMLFLLSLLIIPLLLSCDDDNVIEALPSRYVYFVDQAGTLQRYDITLKKVENMERTNVTRVTPVAANGIVLFEVAPGAETRLYGHCEDGSLIPVPQPVTSGPSEEYIYGVGGAVLSREGHHAAWSVYRRPTGSEDSTEWAQELCRFDCSSWEMNRVDVSVYVREQFEGTNFSPDIIIVRELMISDDGANVIVSVDMMQKEGGVAVDHQSLLLRWQGDALSMLQGNRQGFHLIAFDGSCTTLFYSSAGKGMALDCAGGNAVSKNFSTDHKELLRPSAFTKRTGEYLASYSNGALLALVRVDNGEKTSVLSSVRDITAMFPDIIFGELQDWASVSPDGEWVVFGWIGDNTEYLFTVRRDGTDLRQIGKGRFPIPATISDEIPL